MQKCHFIYIYCVIISVLNCKLYIVHATVVRLRSRYTPYYTPSKYQLSIDLFVQRRIQDCAILYLWDYVNDKNHNNNIVIMCFFNIFITKYTLMRLYRGRRSYKTTFLFTYYKPYAHLCACIFIREKCLVLDKNALKTCFIQSNGDRRPCHLFSCMGRSLNVCGNICMNK